MRRVLEMFPEARFIHVVQHPLDFCDGMMDAVREAAKHGPIPRWLLHLAAFTASPEDVDQASQTEPDVDPQRGWYALNRNIERFLEKVPEGRWLRVRGEDVLADPHGSLPAVCRWLGVHDDAQAVEEMMHPERSPYAGFGPAGAMYGNDAFFLQRPALRPGRAEPRSLQGSLPWREDGLGLLPEVCDMARNFGYE
jgi:hypothetical protein